MAIVAIVAIVVIVAIVAIVVIVPIVVIVAIVPIVIYNEAFASLYSLISLSIITLTGSTVLMALVI